jgi:hypothetical protein
MSAAGPDTMRSVQHHGEHWREEYLPPAPRRGRDGPPWGLVMTGLAVGLGVLAWRYLGPDLRRYLKMRSM